MARVPYLAPGESNDEDLARLYEQIVGLRGSVLNLYRALANQPAALRAFLGMSRYVRDDAALGARLRELAVLATAFALDVAYEKHHHLPAARRAGVSAAQLAAFPDWAASDEFNPAERAVLTYADQVARHRAVTDDAFADLERHLSRPEIIDLALTVGWYHLCAAIIGPLGIEIEGSNGK